MDRKNVRPLEPISSQGRGPTMPRQFARNPVLTDGLGCFRVCHGQSVPSPLRLSGSGCNEVSKDLQIDRSLPVEDVVEQRSTNDIVDRYPSQRDDAVQSRSVLDRVVEGSLLPAWTTKGTERQRRIFAAEQTSGGRVRPPSATSPDATLMFRCVAEVAVRPRELRRPGCFECLSPIAGEVHFLVQLDDESILVSNVPSARSKPWMIDGPAQAPVQADDVRHLRFGERVEARRRRSQPRLLHPRIAQQPSKLIASCPCTNH